MEEKNDLMFDQFNIDVNHIVHLPDDHNVNEHFDSEDEYKQMYYDSIYNAESFWSEVYYHHFLSIIFF